MALKRILPLLLALLVPAVPAFAAETEAASEQTVRAALLFNFIKFTAWPATAAGGSPFRLCIATDDPVQVAALEALGSRTVRGMPLVPVRFIQQADCKVIYVDSPRRWKEIAEKPAGGQALTIGSYPGFARDGGMIEISLKDGVTRFDINLYEAKRAGLHVYPQLLRLARRVME